MKRIYLIDSPGVVPPSTQDTPTDLVLRGVVRITKVSYPSQYIPALLSKVKLHHMEKTYDLKGWQDATGFLELLARKGGRLLKGGEPDLDGVARMVLDDFMRGKIPWFTPAPKSDGDGKEGASLNGRDGKLGEMPRKRANVDSAESIEADKAGESDEEGFQGFGSDTEEGASRRPSFGVTVATESSDGEGVVAGEAEEAEETDETAKARPAKAQATRTSKRRKT